MCLTISPCSLQKREDGEFDFPKRKSYYSEKKSLLRILNLNFAQKNTVQNIFFILVHGKSLTHWV